MRLLREDASSVVVKGETERASPASCGSSAAAAACGGKSWVAGGPSVVVVPLTVVVAKDSSGGAAAAAVVVSIEGAGTSAASGCGSAGGLDDAMMWLWFLLWCGCVKCVADANLWSTRCYWSPKNERQRLRELNSGDLSLSLSPFKVGKESTSKRECMDIENGLSLLSQCLYSNNCLLVERGWSRVVHLSLSKCGGVGRNLCGIALRWWGTEDGMRCAETAARTKNSQNQKIRRNGKTGFPIQWSSDGGREP